jgi:hypothetical protein
MVQKALENTPDEIAYSRRSTRTLTSGSIRQSASPGSPTARNLETYSIVDLVSIDSNESPRSASVYDSANSSAVAFGTPQNGTSRKTRSIDPAAVQSSTPYVGKIARSSRSKSSPNLTRKSSIRNTSRSSANKSVPRRSASLTTPKNSSKNDSATSRLSNSRVSRVSKIEVTIDDTDLFMLSDKSQTLVDSRMTSKSNISEKTQSKRKSSNNPSPLRKSARNNEIHTPTGVSTPENRHSPEEAGTPVLSIQSLLDSSRSSFSSQRSQSKKAFANRKTIGVIRSGTKTRTSLKSKSLNLTTGKMLTPKSGVKIVQEAVKNKHSTAKKPQSKRSIIDELDESDIVKQLFNSPVKRKLSQSMTEFSRRQLFEEDEVKRPTRNTVAGTIRTPDNSLAEITDAYTPERFVSPLDSPASSPNLSGVKRLFQKNSPNNDLRNVSGAKRLFQKNTPHNDLRNIAGVKRLLRTPHTRRAINNSLSGVKNVFGKLPRDDLTRVSGVASLFRPRRGAKSPANSLTDISGVRSLFDSPPVSSAKKKASKKGESKLIGYGDVSGVEELFNESDRSNLASGKKGKKSARGSRGDSLIVLGSAVPNGLVSFKFI